MLFILLCVAVILCGIPVMHASSVAQKFHLMQRHIPRNDFVKVEKSDKSELHELVFAIKQNNVPELDRMLTARSTPGNALYQQWLTHSQIGELTANSQGAQEVLTWLQANDVTASWVSGRQEYIKATACISVWERLLNTEFFLWEDQSRVAGLNSNNRFIHRAVEYFLPEQVKPHLSAVFNTVQVPPVFKPRYHKKDAKFRTDVTIEQVNQPQAGAGAALDGKVTVAFLNSFYQITTNTGDANLQQSVFETAEQSYSPTDLTTFQKNFTLPLQQPLHPYGYNVSTCTFDSCGEGNLDVQYIMGVAQQTATIYWYVTDNSTTDPFVGWLVDVANMTAPPLANSMSWGSIEQFNSPDVMDAFNTEALKLAAMGVTITVSSGDDGVASNPALCNANSASTQSSWPYPSTWTGKGYFPSFPATSPYVTAVGATMGPQAGTPEIVCQSQLGGVITSGGGFSTYYAQPSWQTDAVSDYFAKLPTGQVPAAGYNALGRAYPDVSLIGVWYQVVVQNAMEDIFGTSASSPVFAAMVSLANAARAAQDKPPLGFLNPTLWAYGMSNTFGPGGTSINPYNDVTSGSNKCVAYSGPNPSRAHCCASGFYAAPGWDPTTGFGSVNYTSLVTMFDIGIPPPSAVPTNAPTAKPSAPTVNPTVDPTASPSTEPTATPTTPTTNPTVYPTASPTVTATFAPSLQPIAAPTASPISGTAAPSAAPSAPPSPIISFSSNITLAGLSSPTLDAASQDCVVATTAEAMQLPASAVSYVGTVVLSSSATNPAVVPAADTVTAAEESHLRSRRAEEAHEATEAVTTAQAAVVLQLGLETTYSVVAITYTEVALSDTTYASPDALYSGVTSLLSDSVSSGAYTEKLNANAVLFNTSVLASAEATGEASSPATIISADSSGSGGGSDALSTAEIGGIAAGGFAFLVILCVIAVYLLNGRKEPPAEPEFATPSVSPTSNPVIAGHVTPVQEL